MGRQRSISNGSNLIEELEKYLEGSGQKTVDCVLMGLMSPVQVRHIESSYCGGQVYVLLEDGIVFRRTEPLENNAGERHIYNIHRGSENIFYETSIDIRNQ